MKNNKWVTFSVMHMNGFITFLLYLSLFHHSGLCHSGRQRWETCASAHAAFCISLSLCSGPHPFPFQVRCASSSWTRLCSTSASMTTGPTRWPIRNSLMPSSSLCPTTVTWVGSALTAHCCRCTGEKERAEKGRRHGATDCTPPKSSRTSHKSKAKKTKKTQKRSWLAISHGLFRWRGKRMVGKYPELVLVFGQSAQWSFIFKCQHVDQVVVVMGDRGVAVWAPSVVSSTGFPQWLCRKLHGGAAKSEKPANHSQLVSPAPPSAPFPVFSRPPSPHHFTTPFTPHPHPPPSPTLSVSLGPP